MSARQIPGYGLMMYGLIVLGLEDGVDGTGTG
jgi:hypothetical protein